MSAYLNSQAESTTSNLSLTLALQLHQSSTGSRYAELHDLGSTDRPLNMSNCARVPALLMALLFLVIAPVCRADIRLLDDGGRLRTTITGETVEDVVAALAEQHGFRVRAAFPLNDPILGSYEGTLQRVLSLLLYRYNYFVRPGEDGLEVVILSRQSGMPASASPRISAALPALPPAPIGTPMPNRAPPAPVRPAQPVPKKPPLPPLPTVESPGIPRLSSETAPPMPVRRAL